MTDKELDDLFQSAFTDHQMPVPPDMWERVNPQREKRRRVAFLWWSGLGVAAILILTGLAAWLYRSTPEKTIVSAAAMPIKKDETPAKKEMIPSGQPTPATPGGEPSALSATEAAGSQRNTITGSRERSLTPASGADLKRTTAISRMQGSVRGNDGSNGSTINNSYQAGTNNSTADVIDNNPVAQALPSHTDDTTASSGQLPVPAEKADSAAITNNAFTKQDTKAPAIKVKKIHGEKLLGLELMIAGYENYRNVYAAKSGNYVAPFAEVSRREKVLMHSAGISLRIDKPLTPHLSFKTGLQYLRTRQRVSYGYEDVNQTSSISSFGNDTLMFARLQTKQTSLTGFYNSFSVPLLLSYHTTGSKINLGATAGVMVNVLSWYHGEVPGAGSYQPEAAKDVFRAHTGASLYAGIAASRQLGSFRLFAEPQVQYTLSPVTKRSASFRQRITSYGIGIGIRKTIGR